MLNCQESICSAIYRAFILYFKDNKFLKHLYKLTHYCIPSLPQAHFCSYPPVIVITIIVGILGILVVMVRNCYDRGKVFLIGYARLHPMFVLNLGSEILSF